MCATILTIWANSDQPNTVTSMWNEGVYWKTDIQVDVHFLVSGVMSTPIFMIMSALSSSLLALLALKLQFSCRLGPWHQLGCGWLWTKFPCPSGRPWTLLWNWDWAISGSSQLMAGSMAEQFFQTCVCGCSFSCVSDFTKHKRGCTKGRKRLSGVLSKAKEVYQWKKLQTGLGEAQAEQVGGDDVLPHPELVCAIIFLLNLAVLTEVI